MKRGHCNYVVKVTSVRLLYFYVLHSIICLQAQVPDSSRQLVVAVAPDWNSFRATLTCCERRDEKSPWQAAFKSWPVLLGSKGLTWGRGVFKAPNSDHPEKCERDGKAPAGIFELGRIYGYAEMPPRGTSWPYVQVGAYDAWIDDPKLPHYNEFVRVDPRDVPSWFESQKMRLGDNAYKWLLEIRHNTNPPVPGLGSAIFFHVRRSPDSPTAGCTSMDVNNLEKMLRWLRVGMQPRYILLPREEYEKLRKPWKLP